MLLVGYRFVVLLVCVFTFCVSRLYVVMSANSTNDDYRDNDDDDDDDDTTISQDANAGITQKSWTEDTSDQNNTNVTTNRTMLDGSNSSEITLPSGNVSASTSTVTNTNTSTLPDPETVSRAECVINRGWFRWKVHLQAGRSYFSSSDCTLKVCNEKGDLDFYSCNRLDAWDVLRSSIEREVNEGQLQCLKSGCI